MGRGDVAELDLTDITVAGDLVTELTGLTPSDLDNLLAQSAGTHTDETVTIYRPYYVAAALLRRQPNTKRLQEADGTRFDSPSVTIAAYMRHQASEDERLLGEHVDYAVPAGHEATSGLSGVTF